MTHEQATDRCTQLNAEPERDREWFPKQVGPEEWALVSIAMPGGPTGPLKQTVEVRPEPDEPPDSRSSIVRNIPPYGAG